MNELSLKLAKQMIDCFDSAAMFDNEGRYIFVSDNWLKNRGLKVEDVIGKHAWEVVKDSKVGIVLRTHKPILGEIVESKNGDALILYWPMVENNEFIGVLICSITRGLENIFSLNKKLKLISNELEEYKNKLNYASNACYKIEDIAGDSLAINSMKEQIVLASKYNSTVLIEGETGTGKELVAHAIHNLSERRYGRFVRVNCSAIPQELMESEFFGYEEGAFTGAKKGGKKGKFELADGSSIFLDEINMLPFVMQPKFLRVLQENEVEHIGGKDSIPIDVRVIAATNTSLEKMIEEKKFRSDLFYRLNVLRIRIPPLRERKEDIPIISYSIINKLNNKMGTTINHIENDVFDLLEDYDWPGNVRELQNVIENAMTMVWGEALELKHFIKFKDKNFRQKLIGMQKSNMKLKDIKDEIECQVIVRALKEFNGNKVETAKHLGISRNVLYKKLEKYNLS